MSTAQAFSVATPLSSDKANQIDTFFKNDKIGLDERYALEHVSLQSASGETQTAATAAGRHKPGYVKAVLVDTYANIILITNPQSGTLAYDTTNGRLLVGNGTNWTTYPIGAATPASILAFSAKKNAVQALTANVATRITFQVEDFDYGSCFDITTNPGRFTPNVAGLYQFFATLYFPTAATSCWVRLYKNGALSLYGTQLRSIDALQIIQFSGIVAANGTTDYFDIYGLTTAAGNIDTATGFASSFSGYKIANT